jgi:hypothetical protein
MPTRIRHTVGTVGGAVALSGRLVLGLSGTALAPNIKPYTRATLSRYTASQSG